MYSLHIKEYNSVSWTEYPQIHVDLLRDHPDYSANGLGSREPPQSCVWEGLNEGTSSLAGLCVSMRGVPQTGDQLVRTTPIELGIESGLYNLEQGFAAVLPPCLITALKTCCNVYM